MQRDLPGLELVQVQHAGEKAFDVIGAGRRRGYERADVVDAQSPARSLKRVTDHRERVSNFMRKELVEGAFGVRTCLGLTCSQFRGLLRGLCVPYSQLLLREPPAHLHFTGEGVKSDIVPDRARELAEDEARGDYLLHRAINVRSRQASKRTSEQTNK